VLPDQVWLLEQHPHTTSYVGLQQLFGPGVDASHTVRIVPESDFITYKGYQVRPFLL
jgi:hypothetical protein